MRTFKLDKPIVAEKISVITALEKCSIDIRGDGIKIYLVNRDSPLFFKIGWYVHQRPFVGDYLVQDQDGYSVIPEKLFERFLMEVEDEGLCIKDSN